MTTLSHEEREGISIEQMAGAIGSAMPQLDTTGQRIAVSVYRLLAQGEPVALDAIVRASKIPAAAVDEALNSWPGVFRGDDGSVLGFWGLTVSRLDPEYRLRVDGKTSFAWCALDTLFIPALLGKAVEVASRCPITGETVTLVVEPTRVRELNPPGAVVSMVIPQGRLGYDVIESFCHQVLFFASEEAGERWTAAHPGTSLLTVAEAFRLGRVLSERMSPAAFREVDGPKPGPQGD